jgi:hypothetical protein
MLSPAWFLAERPYFDISVSRSQSTDRAIPLDEPQPTVNTRSTRMVSKMLPREQEMT